MDVSGESKSNSKDFCIYETMHSLSSKRCPREEASSHSAHCFRMRVLKIPGFDFSIPHPSSVSDEFIAQNSHFADCGLKTPRFKKCDAQIFPEKIVPDSTPWRGKGGNRASKSCPLTTCASWSLITTQQFHRNFV